MQQSGYTDLILTAEMWDIPQKEAPVSKCRHVGESDVIFMDGYLVFWHERLFTGQMFLSKLT